MSVVNPHMSIPKPCAIHISYVQCPKGDCDEPVCVHREPHYPSRYNLGSVSVSCRVGDLEGYVSGKCPGCKPVSNTVLVELMNNCHLCQQPEEEEA